MATFEEWTLFLASPGDCTPERDVVRRVVEELNETLGTLGGVRVKVIGWDTDAKPSWGADAQKILNGQIGDMKRHALFVGLFWNRIGTPTPRAKSGTTEEFQNAARIPQGKGPEIMLYFNQKAATLGAAQLKQRTSLLEWKESLQQDGVYWDFKGTRSFETNFRRHYGNWLTQQIGKRTTRAVRVPYFDSMEKAVVYLQRIQNEKDAVKASTKPVKTQATIARKRATATPTAPAMKSILLGDDVFRAEKVIEIGSKWTILLRPQNPVEDRKIRAMCGQLFQRQFLIAYELQAGHAQILGDGQRTNDEKGDLWTIEVRFSGFRGSAINYAGMDIFEFAELRADWLLLAKEPELPAPKDEWDNSNQHRIRQIKGHSDNNKPILPALWKECGGDKEKFTRLAPHIALVRLLENEVCRHVETLKIGPIRAGKVSVDFRGTSSFSKGNGDQIVTVRGVCSLEGAI